MNKTELKKKLEKLADRILADDFEIIKARLALNLSDKLEHGDYSTNLLFLVSQLKKISLGQAFDLFQNKILSWPEVEKIELVNGYLNIFLNQKVFWQDYKIGLKKILAGSKNKIGRGRKVLVEYVSANPTGPLTLANSRGAVIGDCLAKILKLTGFKVGREYYVNDRGNQIKILGQTCLAQLGLIPFAENFYQGGYVKTIARENKNKILKLKEPEKIGRFAANIILKDLIKKPLKKFDVQFDNYFFESNLYRGQLKEKILKLLEKKNLVEKKDGALWLKLSRTGESKNEVLIKSNGEETYFLSDLLYHYNKLIERKNKLAINIVGADHLDHTRRLKKAMDLILGSKGEINFIIYQFVHLIKDQELIRMSKRKGVYISLADLIEAVGPDPIRFIFLRSSPDNQVELDLELIKKESLENPVWYIHYTYARINGILEKAKAARIKPTTNALASFNQLINQPDYQILWRKMHQLPDLIEDIAFDFRVNLLTTWILDLSKLINQFYEREKILSPDKKETANKILFLIFLKTSLDFSFDLLGFTPKNKLNRLDRDQGNKETQNPTG